MVNVGNVYIDSRIYVYMYIYSIYYSLVSGKVPQLGFIFFQTNKKKESATFSKARCFKRVFVGKLLRLDSRLGVGGRDFSEKKYEGGGCLSLI